MIHHSNVPFLGFDDVFIVTTLDGSNTLFSRQHQATYHSVNGAVSESRHVFIQHGLMTQLIRPSIRILEFGFGTGLNAFLSFLFCQKFQIPVDYTGIEPFLIHPDIARKLDYPSYLAATEWEDVLLQMHRENFFVRGDFSFQRFLSIDGINSDQSFDCIFFDAFDPVTEPRLWSQEIFDLLFSLTSTGGCLTTYCAQGEVRRSLVRSGFQVERIPGAPGKRQMIYAIKP